MDRDSSVGIATRYGLGGPGIKSRWGGAKFSALVQTGTGAPPSFLCNGYWVSFPGVKRPGRGVDHLPLSSAEGKERVELYFYSPSGPSWLVGMNFTFVFTLLHVAYIGILPPPPG